MKKEKTNKVVIGKKLSKGATVSIIVAGYLAVLILGVVFILGTSFFGHRNDLLRLATNRGDYALHHFTSYPDQTFSTDFFLFSRNGILVVSARSFLSGNELNTLRNENPNLLEKRELYTIRRLNTGATINESKKTTCIVAGKVVTANSGLEFGSFVVRELGDLDMTIMIFAGICTLLYATAVVLLTIISKQHQDFIQLQRDLISNVSHELKTPITSIRAMGELIYDGMYVNEEDRKRYARTVISESDRLKDLVGEILDLGKLQSNRVEFNKRPFFADGIFTPVIDSYMMLASDTGVEMSTDKLHFEAVPELYTDANQIVRVLRIILENALKFAGPGGKVYVTQQILSKYVVICVSDNGPGIKEEDMGRIFERFYKVDVTHNSQGSGLGLSIAAEIIKNLNEKIWVESVEGQGTTFYFTVGYRLSVPERLLSRS